MNQVVLKPTDDSARNRRALGLSGAILIVALLAGFYINPLLAIAMGLVVALASFISLERSLLFFLIGTLLWPYTMGWNVGPLLWGPSRLLFILMIFAWVLAYIRGEVSFHRTPVDLALLIFITVMLISFMVNAPYMLSDQFSIALKMLGYITVEWLLLYYLVSTIPKNWQQVRKILVYISIIISIVALVGILEFITGIRFYEWLRPMLPGGDHMRSNIHEVGLQLRQPSLVRGDILRIVSTTISFQEVGTFMAMTIPLLLYFLAYSRTRRQTILWLVMIALTTGALFLSVTRGAFLAAVIAILIITLFSKRSLLRSSFLFMIAIVLVTLMIFPNLFVAAQSVIAPGIEEGTIQGRLHNWPAAITMLTGNELFGIGPGQVVARILAVGNAASGSLGVTDNYYVKMTVELGALGLGAILIVWGVIISVLGGKRRLKGDLGDEVRDMRIAILASLVAFMIMCFTYDALAFMAVSKFFWLLLGLGIALTRLEGSMQNKYDLPIRGRKTLITPCLI